jgi:hypothetical protein
MSPAYRPAHASDKSTLISEAGLAERLIHRTVCAANAM